MADIHNGIKYATELAAGIGIWAGVDRSSEGVSRISETIEPSLDITAVPDLAWLRREYLWTSGRLTSNAVAAELSAIAVSNPPLTTQPGWLLTVEQVIYRELATFQAVALGVSFNTTLAATLTPSTGVFARDTRSGTAPNQLYQILPFTTYTGSDPATIDGVLEGGAASVSVTGFFLTVPYILRPGTGLFVQGTIVNQGIEATFSGRARRALPGELDPRNAI